MAEERIRNVRKCEHHVKKRFLTEDPEVSDYLHEGSEKAVS